MDAGGSYRRDETEAHRLDRNLNELLQELRVMGAGVQILFAFLLTIAFQPLFLSMGTAQQAIYVTVLVLLALSIGLLLAPVAIHRLTFHQHIRDEVVRASNILALSGLGVLALALSGSVLLVLDRVGGWALAVPLTLAVAAMMAVLWLVVPVALRRRHHRPPPAATPPGEG